jgi:hypothetical protein
LKIAGAYLTFYLAYQKVAQAVRQLEELPTFSIPYDSSIGDG